MHNIENYTGREHGYVKHVLVGKYLRDFAPKVFSKWKRVVYVDAFAGPWGTQDANYEDSSFGISIPILKKGRLMDHVLAKHGCSPAVSAYLVEKDPKAFKALEAYGLSQIEGGVEVVCFNEKFEAASDEIGELIRTSEWNNTFVFALIDPKGWSGLSMSKLTKLFPPRSSEVLVNVMTSFIKRFVDVESCKDSYEDFFGRGGVGEIIQACPREDREDVVVREYCRSLRNVCGFDYVSSCVVMDQKKNSIKYFMVFGTNSPVGLQVFKNAEAKAANVQDDIKKILKEPQAMDLPFDDINSPTYKLREHYKCKAMFRVDEFLRSEGEASYCEVYCKAMAMPLVTEGDLLQHLYSSPNVTVKLIGKRRQKPSIDKRKGDVIVWT